MRIIEHPNGRRVVKVSRKYLESLIREAIDEDEDNPARDETEKSREKPSVSTADPSTKNDDEDIDGNTGEVPDTEDPADDEIDPGKEDTTHGKLANELVGKTIQSVTMEPKSKLLPGATEIVITFNEITDPLRILIGKTGQARFYFRNALHNLI